MTKIQFASAIQTARESLGLTRTQLAQMSGISRPTVQRLEEANLASLALIIAVCDALGLEIKAVSSDD